MKNQVNIVNNEKGTVLVLTAMSLFVIMGMIGLAIDLGNGYVNKTRLQNALDATALSAAISLTDGSFAAATTNGRTTFDLFGLPITSATDVAICFFDSYASINLGACPGATDTSLFVRASNTTPLALSTFFATVIGWDTLNITASAVSGPLALNDVCSLIPVLACATMTATDGTGDVVDEDCGLYSDSGACFGYTQGDVYTLKTSDWDDQTVGPGNFGYLDFPDSSGFDAICEALAGAVDCSVIDTSIETQPGGGSGPTSCLNVRFDDYTHGRAAQFPAADYPPDTIIDEASYDFGAYTSDQDSGGGTSPVNTGEENRRVVHMPMVDCGDGVSTNGSSGTPLDVVGMGCFFLTQKVIEGGNNPDKFSIFTEFIGDKDSDPDGRCELGAQPIPDSDASPFAPQRIVLYKDRVSHDS